MSSKALIAAVFLASIGPRAFAGSDSAPASPDAKEVKSVGAASSAKDAGFYVGVYGGAQFATGYENRRQVVDIHEGASFDAAPSKPINSDWGGVGGVKGGYRFNSFPLCDFMGLRLQPAIESEAFYIGNGSYSRINTLTINTPYHFDSDSADLFVNGILRLVNNTCVTPYVGIGAGGQYLTRHGDIKDVAPIETTTIDFAAQALGGFDVRLSSHLTVFTEYKFVDAIGTDAETNLGLGQGVRGYYRFEPDQIQQNLITVGAKYEF